MLKGEGSTKGMYQKRGKIKGGRKKMFHRHSFRLGRKREGEEVFDNFLEKIREEGGTSCAKETVLPRGKRKRPLTDKGGEQNRGVSLSGRKKFEERDSYLSPLRHLPRNTT